MTHYCDYCNEPFIVFRKDKKYCTHSCKQMAFLKRQECSLNFVRSKNQNVNNTIRQIDETSNGQNVKSDLILLDNAQETEVETSIKEQTTKTSTNSNQPVLFERLNEQIYSPIYCKWINELNERFDERGNNEWFRRHITSQIQWVSLHYRCLLDTVLIVSDMKNIEWVDLAEITNAFTFFITTNCFKDLPADYPFTKEIILLREKLNNFCLETQEEEYVQFRLKFKTKKEFLLQRYELASVFSKINYNQLQLDFKTENDKRIAKLKEEQEATLSAKEKPWRSRYKSLNRESEY